MASNWSTIQQDPIYQALDDEEKRRVQERFWENVISQDSTYQQLAPEEQERVRTRFFDSSPAPAPHTEPMQPAPTPHTGPIEPPAPETSAPEGEQLIEPPTERLPEMRPTPEPGPAPEPIEQPQPGQLVKKPWYERVGDVFRRSLAPDRTHEGERPTPQPGPEPTPYDPTAPSFFKTEEEQWQYIEDRYGADMVEQIKAGGMGYYPDIIPLGFPSVGLPGGKPIDPGALGPTQEIIIKQTRFTVDSLRRVAMFVGLSEAENKIVSELLGEQYEPGAILGRGHRVSELLPEGTSPQVAEIIDFLSFIGKAMAVGQIDKAIKHQLQLIAARTLETTKTERLYLSAKDLQRALGITGEGEVKADPALVQRVREHYLALSKEQFARAVREGVDIEVMTKDITRWDPRALAILKKLFNIQPVSNRVIHYGEATFRIHGEPGQPPTQPPVAGVPKTSVAPTALPPGIVQPPGAVPPTVPPGTEAPPTPPEAPPTPPEAPPASPEAPGKEPTTLVQRRVLPGYTKPMPPLVVNPDYSDRWGKFVDQFNRLVDSPLRDKVLGDPSITPGQAKIYITQVAQLAGEMGGYAERQARWAKEFLVEGEIQHAISAADEALSGVYVDLLDHRFATMAEHQAVDRAVNTEASPTTETPSPPAVPETPPEVTPPTPGVLPASPEVAPTQPEAPAVKTEEQATDLQMQQAQEADQHPETLPQAQPEDIDPDVLYFLPQFNEINETSRKLSSMWDVEAPLKKAEAPDTGFALKNYFSQQDALQQEGLGFIGELNRMYKETGLDAQGIIDAVYASESGEYLRNLPQAQRDRIERIVQRYEQFKETWENRFKAIGWMERPFPESLVLRNNETIIDYRKKMARGNLTDAQRAKLRDEIAALEEQNRRVQDLDVKFVSVPIRMILNQDGEGPISGSFTHFMRILPKWGRKTLLVRDLVEEGVLDPKYADLRHIVGEYVERMSRTYAIGKVFEAARREGLIVRDFEKPDWPRFTAKIIPQLKNMRFNPAFNDMLVGYFGAIQRGRGIRGVYEHVVALTKMMQFYNPVFLPMYDTMQAVAAGTYLSTKLPRNMAKAWRMMRDRDPEFIELLEEGMASQPFTMPWQDFRKQMQRAIGGRTWKEVFGQELKNPLMALYQLSWNLAWKGDAYIRTLTALSMKDQGFSAHDAAQIAAKYHSDYASVPPDVRRGLNKVFFTPTFKITMSKLYGRMLEGAAKTIFTPGSATRQDKNYARGLLLAFAMLEGIGQVFRRLGYEEEQKYRRYVRTVDTEDGPKESVITIANPFNIPWRYYYRLKGAVEHPSLNKLERIFGQTRYELTPLLQVGFDILYNTNERVYKQGDDAERQLLSAAKYAVGELVAITKPLIEVTGEPTRDRESMLKSQAVFQRELGTLYSTLLRPFVFHYLRDTGDVRILRDIYRLEQEFRRAIRFEENLETRQRVLENFYEELEKMHQKLDEYYK